MSSHARAIILNLVAAVVPVIAFAQANDVVTDTATESIEIATEPSRALAALKCPHYKVYYIDPSAQFFTPPVPLEDHAEYVFCSDHENLDAIRTRLSKMKPIGSHADAGAARIKVVPRGKPGDALIFCSTGEITYRGKQYRLDRRFYEPSLLSLREEGDRQRAMAIEKEDDRDDSRNPASNKSSKMRSSGSAAVGTAKTKTATTPSTSPSTMPSANSLPTPTATPPGF